METKSNTQDQTIKAANEAVEKAFQAIIKEVKQTLAQLPTPQLRTYVERKGANDTSQSFYCPLAYVSVTEYFGKTIIAYAKNFKAKPHVGMHIDTMIVRAIYKLTSVEVTKTFIEDRVEEYVYQSIKFEDALKHAGTLENYKKDIVSPTMEKV
jgi:hypothetical protein